MNNRLKGRFVAALKSFLGAIQLLQAEGSCIPSFGAARYPAHDYPRMQRRGILLFSARCSSVCCGTAKAFCPPSSCSYPSCGRFDLKWSEIEWIASVGHIAGRYDAATQADRLSGLIAQLEQALQQAQEEYGQKGKLYRALGVTAGVMIALVAI